MKLSDLGLKQKPQTKYFEGGFISFSTDEKELYFEIFQVTKKGQHLLSHGHITHQLQFDAIMDIKDMNHALVVITSWNTYPTPC